MPKKKTASVLAFPKKSKKKPPSKPKSTTKKSKQAFLPNGEPSPTSFIGSKGMYLSNKELLAELKVCKAADNMSDKLARMLQLLCAKYGKKGNFANYCVDEDTTALTKRGWMSCEELRSSDEILSYDTKSNQLKWSRVLDIFINRDYDGVMHHLTTRGMDALVTPNHKFVSKERGIIPVEDIICNEHIILTGDSVKEDIKKMYNNSFIQLVGWAVTEGHYIKGSKVKRAITISQKQGPKADDIRKCLLESAIPFKEYTFVDDLQTFNCTGPLITEIYNTIAPNRVLSNNFILSLTPEQRLLLIKTMVAGDGWIRPNGAMSYVQKSKEHVNSFLMLCSISGLLTSTRQGVYKTPVSGVNPNGGKSIVYTINMFDPSKRFCKAELIDFHGGRTTPGGKRSQKKNIPTVHYDGTIWCPQTEYGTFVCRRNEYIYVTGNTYNDDMQGYAMLMLVRTWRSFDPKKSNNPFAFFTQCIKNSFIQYLNQEKRQRVIRDELLVDQGMTPSFNFQDSGHAPPEETEIDPTTPSHGDDEEDHEVFEHDLKILEKQIENIPDDLPEGAEVVIVPPKEEEEEEE